MATTAYSPDPVGQGGCSASVRGVGSMEPRTSNRHAKRSRGVAAVVGFVVALLGVVTTASPVDAAPTAATLTLTLNKGSIRADGHDSASIQIAASTGGVPLGNVTAKLSIGWATPLSAGAAKVRPGSVRLDAEGGGSATVTSTRSGTMTISAAIEGSRYAGTTSIGLDAVRHSVVVLVDGASTVVTCPTPDSCADSSGELNPVSSALEGEGFAPSDIATFSYAGGSIDPSTGSWVPHASTCADSGLSYKEQLSTLRTMLRAIANANPNTDISVVGLSQGGLLAYQTIMLAATLPKGSRLTHVVTLDAPLGGIPLSEILHLEAEAPTACWSQGGSAKAARQLVGLWNTTAPDQGPMQGDNASTMCASIGFTDCPSETNAQALSSASGIGVQTWGNTEDGIFDPSSCGFAGYPYATDSQIVSAAAGGLHPEGTFPGSSCTIESHIVIVTNRAEDIALTIGPQQSS